MLDQELFKKDERFFFRPIDEYGKKKHQILSNRVPDENIANIVDILNSRIFPGTVLVAQGRIKSIIEEGRSYKTWLVPGLIDSHVHVESSMLVPSQFSRLAALHGTVAAVADPHEIANVLGIEGVEFMVADGQSTPFRFYFGAPSCVPATPFETAGAELGPREIEILLERGQASFLAEMMNFPGVINNDHLVWQKIQVAQSFGKTIDGHAPGLKGEALKKYCAAGISTDHKQHLTKKAWKNWPWAQSLIRNGSAARDFDALCPLIRQYPGQCMLCSDDLHPNDLAKAHKCDD